MSSTEVDTIPVAAPIQVQRGQTHLPETAQLTSYFTEDPDDSRETSTEEERWVQRVRRGRGVPGLERRRGGERRQLSDEPGDGR